MTGERVTRALRVGVVGARRGADVAQRGQQKLRRARFIAAARAAAVRVRSTVELDVAPDLRVDRDVRVTFEPGTHSRLSIGPGCHFEDDVLIMLKGGQVELGPRVELRRGVVLSVAGHLTMRADNVISWGGVIHCSNRVDLAEMAAAAEHVTIADSSHFWTTPEEHFWHNVRTGEVTVGRNTWLCPKVTIGRGAHVGAYCLVASNSVVVGRVPDGSFASGVPVTIRPLALPWQQALAEAQSQTQSQARSQAQSAASASD